MERKTVNVSGSYSPGSGRIVVKRPEDLVTNRIHVSPDAVAATWGAEAAQAYQQAMAAQRAADNGSAAKSAPNA